MSSWQQILSVLLGAAPYILTFVLLLCMRRLRDISPSSIVMGFVGIVGAVAVGGLAGLFVIMNNPQTGSTVNNTFLTGVLALMIVVAMLVGELFRYFLVRRALTNEKREPLVSLSYGIGYSLGEFAIYLIPLILSRGEYAAWDASAVIAVDVAIQIMVSVVAYELIRQNNYAFIAVCGLYYLSFFLSYALHNSVALNIAAKGIVFIIALALVIVFWPRHERKGDEA